MLCGDPHTFSPGLRTGLWEPEAEAVSGVLDLVINTQTTSSTLEEMVLQPVLALSLCQSWLLRIELDVQENVYFGEGVSLHRRPLGWSGEEEAPLTLLSSCGLLAWGRDNTAAGYPEMNTQQALVLQVSKFS